MPTFKVPRLRRVEARADVLDAFVEAAGLRAPSGDLVQEATFGGGR